MLKRSAYRHQVLEQVSDQVVRHGCINGLKLQTVADRSQLSLWAVRYHFPNPDQLFRAVALHLKGQVLDSLRGPPAAQPSIIQSILEYARFLARAMAAKPYRDFTYLVVRNAESEMWLANSYDEIMAAAMRGMEEIVFAAGQSQGQTVLLRQGAARKLFKRIEHEMVLPTLVPPFADAGGVDLDEPIRRIAAEAFEATYVFEWEPATAA